MSERFCIAKPGSGATLPCVECDATGDYNVRAACVARSQSVLFKTTAELERGVYAFTQDHPDSVDPPCHCGMDECLAPGVYICVLHGKAAEREFEQGEATR